MPQTAPPGTLLSTRRLPRKWFDGTASRFPAISEEVEDMPTEPAALQGGRSSGVLFLLYGCAAAVPVGEWRACGRAPIKTHRRWQM
jgi:hypothetical protein